MSIGPPVTEEDLTRIYESQGLRGIRDSIQSNEPLTDNYERIIEHLAGVFSDARNASDTTGRRERLIQWYGDDAPRVISTFGNFILAYWDTCLAAEQLVPFSGFFGFYGQQRQAEVLAVIDQLLASIDLFGKGFAPWPPPRAHTCF